MPAAKCVSQTSTVQFDALFLDSGGRRQQAWGVVSSTAVPHHRRIETCRFNVNGSAADAMSVGQGGELSLGGGLLGIVVLVLPALEDADR